MTIPAREVLERHPECASDLRVHVMNDTSKTIRRNPLRHRSGFKEGAIDLLWIGAKHSVESDCAIGHWMAPWQLERVTGRQGRTEGKYVCAMPNE
jgi:hypothetical protein